MKVGKRAVFNNTLARTLAALVALTTGAISAPARAVPAAALPPSGQAANFHRARALNASLIAAVKSRDVVAVRGLLASGADPDTRQSRPSGEPVLLTALIAGDSEMVSTLLAYGADPNARDGRGTPLLVAAASLVGPATGVDALRVLLEQGRPDVDATDTAALGDDRSALHMASVNGSASLARLLLAHGADPNLRNRFGETPISFAAERGHVEVARALVQRGADPNVVTRFTRMSPLMAAAENGRAEMVLFLLSLRANPAGRNAFGETTLTLARAARNRVPASAPEWRSRIDRAVSALERRL